MVTSLDTTQPPLFTTPHSPSLLLCSSCCRRPCAAGTARPVTGTGGGAAGATRWGACGDDCRPSPVCGLGIKDERYIKKRGWSIDSIKDVIKRPHTTRKAFNKSTGNQATVYYNKQGNYVVIDDTTKELIQTSKYGDKNWIPDSTIQNLYKPHD